MTGYPAMRLRRLRRTRGLRRMTDAPLPSPQQFCWPVFVRAGTGIREPIASMPGQHRWSRDTLIEAVAGVVAQGIGSVLVFGITDACDKTADGAAAWRPDGVVPQALRALRSEFPELVLISDVCLCAATDHGHCGPLDGNGQVDNDEAIALLGRIAATHAAAGADLVAPSAMMDGQVAAIRAALDDHGFPDTAILSYSSKFASAFYGPFRDAAHSAPGRGDRQGYQTSYRNPRLARRESLLDLAEGADALMVKPALAYLDVLADLRARTDLPLAAYNVSGEYSMLQATADRGWGDLGALVRESLCAMVRAGADLVITYWADRYREFFADDHPGARPR
jgi:porphobilinogen synthase